MGSSGLPYLCFQSSLRSSALVSILAIIGIIYRCIGLNDAARSEATGCLFQCEPSGIRDARNVRIQYAGNSELHTIRCLTMASAQDRSF